MIMPKCEIFYASINKGADGGGGGSDDDPDGEQCSTDYL